MKLSIKIVARESLECYVFQKVILSHNPFPCLNLFIRYHGRKPHGGQVQMTSTLLWLAMLSWSLTESGSPSWSCRIWAEKMHLHSNYNKLWPRDAKWSKCPCCHARLIPTSKTSKSCICYRCETFQQDFSFLKTLEHTRTKSVEWAMADILVDLLSYDCPFTGKKRVAGCDDNGQLFCAKCLESKSTNIGFGYPVQFCMITSRDLEPMFQT